MTLDPRVVARAGGLAHGDGAAEIIDFALNKPKLVIHKGNLPATAEGLRDLLAASGRLFDRGLPVRVIRPADGSLPSAFPLTKHNVVMEAHRLCQPVKLDGDGEHPVTLPDRVAQMYLDMAGEWNLLPLAGVCTSPLLSAMCRPARRRKYDCRSRTARRSCHDRRNHRTCG